MGLAESIVTALNHFFYQPPICVVVSHSCYHDFQKHSSPPPSLEEELIGRPITERFAPFALNDVENIRQYNDSASYFVASDVGCFTLTYK